MFNHSAANKIRTAAYFKSCDFSIFGCFIVTSVATFCARCRMNVKFPIRQLNSWSQSRTLWNENASNNALYVWHLSESELFLICQSVGLFVCLSVCALDRPNSKSSRWISKKRVTLINRQGTPATRSMASGINISAILFTTFWSVLRWLLDFWTMDFRDILYLYFSLHSAYCILFNPAFGCNIK